MARRQRPPRARCRKAQLKTALSLVGALVLVGGFAFAVSPLSVSTTIHGGPFDAANGTVAGQASEGDPPQRQTSRSELGAQTPERDRDPGSDQRGQSETRETTSRLTPAAGSTPQPLQRSRIERAIHERINAVRSERGLSTLSTDSELRSIARSHSEDMASRDFFSHTNPDGEDFADRYSAARYTCRARVQGGQYLTGGENIAATYAYSDVIRGDGTVNYDGNETRIARGIVGQWMNSRGHRENILEPAWNNEGIGVALDRDDGRVRVYATQNFC